MTILAYSIIAIWVAFIGGNLLFAVYMLFTTDSSGSMIFIGILAATGALVWAIGKLAVTNA